MLSCELTCCPCSDISQVHGLNIRNKEEAVAQEGQKVAQNTPEAEKGLHNQGEGALLHLLPVSWRRNIEFELF